MKVPILFGEYGWNYRQNPSDYEGMYHLSNWNDVCNLLMKYTFEEYDVCFPHLFLFEWILEKSFFPLDVLS